MYTVEVAVGTPEQAMDVVVDTGSNELVVESCLCRDQGYCSPRNKCFSEDNSSSLSLVQGPRGPSTTIMTFGSGSILTEVASDRVRVGTAVARLREGVMLMVDQLLDFGGPFEGILGLGLPGSKDGPLALRVGARRGPFDEDAGAEAAKAAAGPPRTVQMGSHDGIGPFVPPPPSAADGPGSSGPPGPPRPGAGDAQGAPLFHEDAAAAAAAQQPRAGAGFVGQAGIERFSVCISTDPEADSGGELRLNPPEVQDALKSVGTMHWGLDFRGASVGTSPEPLGFCSTAHMQPTQQTPCGAIPDSGTTYIMGPEDQIIALTEGICDQWPRCSRNYTSMVEAAAAAKTAAMDRYQMDPWNIRPMEKAALFEMLLRDCDSWLDEETGLGELPPIHFHLADDSGATKTLTIDPEAYAISTLEKERKIIYQDLPGRGRFPVGYKLTGRTAWVCRMAIGALDYPTARNGPAWILGMPIFRSYVVGFDVSREPPAVSFAPGPCSGCAEGTSLLARGMRASSRARWPRRLHGAPRLPRVNLSEPL